MRKLRVASEGGCSPELAPPEFNSTIAEWVLVLEFSAILLSAELVEGRDVRYWNISRFVLVDEGTRVVGL